MKEENSTSDKNTSSDVEVTKEFTENKMASLTKSSHGSGERDLFWQYKQAVSGSQNKDNGASSENEDVKSIRLFDVVEIPDDDNFQHQHQHQEQEQEQSQQQLQQQQQQLQQQHEQQSKAYPRKRGRPSTSDLVRNWTDREIFILIDAWKEHENLYNTRLRHCYNRNDRTRALATVERVLTANGILGVNDKQIVKKITDLKRYYGSQKKLYEDSKQNAAANGNKELFVSNWKFYEKLEFLNDAFSPRNGSVPKRFMDYEDEFCGETSPTMFETESMSPSFSSQQDNMSQIITSQNITPQNVTSKIIASQNISLENVASQNIVSQNYTSQNIASQNVSLQNIASQNKTSQKNNSLNLTQNITSQNSSQSSLQNDMTVEPIRKLLKGTHSSPTPLVSIQRQLEEDEDDAFCHLLKQQLMQIPDCEMKDDLKINLQQMVLKSKRHVKQTHAYLVANQIPIFSQTQ